MESEVVLLPCPFCGAGAEDGYEGFCDPRYRVKCSGCGAQTVYCDTPGEAPDLWNRRAVSAEAAP